MQGKRRVLLTNGMSNDFMLIITDAPQQDIEKWCVRYTKAIEDGTFGKEVLLFDTLKAQYYVKELLDSEIDNKDDLDIIGYDEDYDICDYYEEELPDFSSVECKLLCNVAYNLIVKLFEDNKDAYEDMKAPDFKEYVCSSCGITGELYNMFLNEG